VITVGSLNAGNGSGTIPAEARLGITLRSFSPGTRERVRAGVRDLVNGIAAAHGLTVTRAPPRTTTRRTRSSTTRS
jgi:hippurate hydrolase